MKIAIEKNKLNVVADKEVMHVLDFYSKSFTILLPTRPLVQLRFAVLLLPNLFYFIRI